uniref:Uncharacterized protein n=1 Tax=Arundo donax TaxID=35708 RepID=A0A0A9H0L1_ARUDO
MQMKNPSKTRKGSLNNKISDHKISHHSIYSNHRLALKLTRHIWLASTTQEYGQIDWKVIDSDIP